MAHEISQLKKIGKWGNSNQSNMCCSAAAELGCNAQHLMKVVEGPVYCFQSGSAALLTSCCCQGKVYIKNKANVQYWYCGDHSYCELLQTALLMLLIFSPILQASTADTNIYHATPNHHSSVVLCALLFQGSARACCIHLTLVKLLADLLTHICRVIGVGRISYSQGFPKFVENVA